MERKKTRYIYTFINRVGYHSCEIVTADGGFDFSNDFNQQEEVFLQLFLKVFN